MAVCEVCSNIQLKEAFMSPKEYLECLKYIQQLVDSDNFEFVSKDCDTDKVEDDNRWFNDSIEHVIKCKSCGQYFTCCCDTYHGNGNFKKC